MVSGPSTSMYHGGEGCVVLVAPSMGIKDDGGVPNFLEASHFYSEEMSKIWGSGRYPEYKVQGQDSIGNVKCLMLKSPKDRQRSRMGSSSGTQIADSDPSKKMILMNAQEIRYKLIKLTVCIERKSVKGAASTRSMAAIFGVCFCRLSATRLRAFRRLQRLTSER